MGKFVKVQQILADDRSSLAETGNAPQLGETYAAPKRFTSWLRYQIGIDDFDRQLEAICRTLCCNDFSDHIEPVDRNRIEYQALLEHLRT